MPRTEAFDKSLKIFRQDLRDTILKKVSKLSLDKAEEAVDIFVKTAKETLIRNSNPSPESKGVVDKIAKSIHKVPIHRNISGEKIISGYRAIIPMDAEGLVMFLEYGTGLVGKNNPHPQTDIRKVYPEEKYMGVWRYAVNERNYKTIKFRNKYNRVVDATVPCYVERNGYKGFIFRKQGNHYIDAEDEVFSNEPITTRFHWVRASKNGRNKAYVRYNHKKTKTYAQKSQYVFSRGIKPVKFIYTAKHRVMEFIRNNKK